MPTKDVNKVIAAAQQRQPAGGGAQITYAVQGAIDPPTFTLFVNREIPQHYLRYIERTIREEFGLVRRRQAPGPQAPVSRRGLADALV